MGEIATKPEPCPMGLGAFSYAWPKCSNKRGLCEGRS